MDVNHRKLDIGEIPEIPGWMKMWTKPADGLSCRYSKEHPRADVDIEAIVMLPAELSEQIECKHNLGFMLRQRIRTDSGGIISPSTGILLVGAVDSPRLVSLIDPKKPPGDGGQPCSWPTVLEQPNIRLGSIDRRMSYRGCLIGSY